jgi:hypothetical protein
LKIFSLGQRMSNPAGYDAAQKERQSMMNQQMELGFGRARLCPSLTRRERRLNRAQWWFQRMRRVVDRAFDWRPDPPPRPEQIWFPE